MAERLKIIIEAAQLDFQQLRPGDWMNLRDEVGMFLEGNLDGGDGWSAEAPAKQSKATKDAMALAGGIQGEPEEGHDLKDMSDKALEAALVGLKPFITNLSKGQAAIEKPEVSFQVKSDVGVAPYLSIEGSFRDVARFVIAHLVTRLPAKTIAPCPEYGECKRLFVRFWKKKYCSVACETRAHVRRYREKAVATDPSRTRGQGKNQSKGRDA